MNLGRSLIIFALLSSCASSEPVTKAIVTGQCGNSSHDLATRHLSISAKIKASRLAYCFQNYLKFEEKKKQQISTCNQISVKRSGLVVFAQVTSNSKGRMPKDLKMCLTQEFRQMDFKELQLSHDLTIKFPLTFSSI